MRCRLLPSLLVVTLTLACAGKPRPPAAPGEAPCAGHDAAVSAFRASLIVEKNQPPRADPRRSPALADALLAEAEACLQRRGVAYQRQDDALRIEPGATHPADVAAKVGALTQGAVLYSKRFFLERPYAAAAFDKDANTLFLPHAAITGTAQPAIAHELVHVEGLAAFRQQPRMRHLLLQSPETRPNALDVDEIFAYGTSSDDRMRAFAAQYVTMARAALGHPELTISLSVGGTPLEATSSLKGELTRLLACADDALKAASREPLWRCDAPLQR